ncbi:hypothetical protein [Qipengyuania sp. S6317L1]|uniref:hypothetical protein n=1 Tax=Qipengyuania sp. S6317L1 TaxID=2926410 RepID=UPI001FF4EBB1|nr:hypothetical protein [Qipengyuania sp. S6317L1]
MAEIGRSLSHGERQERGRNGFVQKEPRSGDCVNHGDCRRGMGSLGKLRAVDDLPAVKKLIAQFQQLVKAIGQDSEAEI